MPIRRRPSCGWRRSAGSDRSPTPPPEPRRRQPTGTYRADNNVISFRTSCPAESDHNFDCAIERVAAHVADDADHRHHRICRVPPARRAPTMGRECRAYASELPRRPSLGDRDRHRFLLGECSTGAQRSLHGREQARRDATNECRRTIDPELRVGVEEDDYDRALMCDRQPADRPGRVDARSCARARSRSR